MEKIQWVQIENTRACNLKCIYCDRNNKKNNNVHMSIDLGKKIIKELTKLPNLKNILIQGFGEPFLYKKFHILINIIKDKLPDVSIQTVTNGMVYNEQVIKIIPKINILYISIDSLSKEYWRQIRIGGDINIIKENLVKFHELNNSMDIIINTVVSQYNFESLHDICNFCCKNNYYGVQFIPLYPVVNDISKYYSNYDSFWALITEKINELNHLFPSIKIYSPYSIKKQDECLWISKGLYILYDGQVTPCCVMSSDDQVVYGQLGKQNIEEILKSKEKYNRIFNLQERCKECKGLSFYKIWNNVNPLPLII